jgi:hypothetical protein
MRSQLVTRGQRACPAAARAGREQPRYGRRRGCRLRGSRSCRNCWAPVLLAVRGPGAAPTEHRGHNCDEAWCQALIRSQPTVRRCSRMRPPGRATHRQQGTSGRLVCGSGRPEERLQIP